MATVRRPVAISTATLRTWHRRRGPRSPAWRRTPVQARPASLNDDLQHLGGRGLLLQRLGEVVGALSDFVEQAHVLDGDDGLIGECLNQLNLLGSERPYRGSGDNQCADRNAFPHASGTPSTVRFTLMLKVAANCILNRPARRECEPSWPSSNVRPVIVSRPGRTERPFNISSYSGANPKVAATL